MHFFIIMLAVDGTICSNCIPYMLVIATSTQLMIGSISYQNHQIID